MATFTLTINVDNMAFSDRERGEAIARILTETARRVRNDTEAVGYSFAVQDGNGNTVGRAELLEGANREKAEPMGILGSRGWRFSAFGPRDSRGDTA